MSDRADALMARVLRAYREALGEHLTALYLHGSYVLGGFRWETSDLDYLVIVEREPEQSVKRALIQTLLDLTPEAPPKGFEMSVVLRADCDPFVYPTPYCLHFSNMHEARARQDIAAYCEGMHGLDPDLAAHAAVTRSSGIALYGPEPCAIIGDVPREAFLDSVWRDICGAREDMKCNPMYVTLTLCRVLGYAFTGEIMSKARGGAWGIETLPQYQSVIRPALDAYERGAPMPSPSGARDAYCEDMLKRIQDSIKGLYTQEGGNRV